MSERLQVVAQHWQLSSSLTSSLKGGNEVREQPDCNASCRTFELQKITESGRFAFHATNDREGVENELAGFRRLRSEAALHRANKLRPGTPHVGHLIKSGGSRDAHVRTKRNQEALVFVVDKYKVRNSDSMVISLPICRLMI